MMKCVKCGVEIDEKSAFCPECGAKQVKKYQKIFERNGLNETDFIDNINKWFQLNPKVANVSCKFEMDTSIGLLANKYQLNRFSIEYELFKNDNENQYALVKEEKLALTKTKSKDFVAQWKESHPNVKVVNWEGGTHSRGQTVSHLLGGLGARNRLNVYILFKFPKGK